MPADPNTFFAGPNTDTAQEMLLLIAVREQDAQIAESLTDVMHPQQYQQGQLCRTAMAELTTPILAESGQDVAVAAAAEAAAAAIATAASAVAKATSAADALTVPPMAAGRRGCHRGSRDETTGGNTDDLAFRSAKSLCKASNSFVQFAAGCLGGVREAFGVNSETVESSRNFGQYTRWFAEPACTIRPKPGEITPQAPEHQNLHAPTGMDTFENYLETWHFSGSEHRPPIWAGYSAQETDWPSMP